MKGIIDYLIANIFNILLVVGGFAAIIIYFVQNHHRNQEAAALIVNQIEELKEKIFKLNDITVNNTINEKAFYESSDIIVENQWEKYKHLFIRKIDSYSFKTINQFYESVLSIREQLLFTKQLQHNYYANIQTIINYNCNTYALETISQMQSSSFAGERNGINDFSKIYGEKKSLVLALVNQSPYILYVPTQVAETYNKAINNINSIEVIGCEGFRKLKKIAKIK